MRPEIVRDAPGSCPKCGMTLIPILEAIPRAAALSCAISIKQKRVSAFGYNARGNPLATSVPCPAFDLLLSPVVAGATMALSSVSVVTKALRLRRARL